MMPYGFKLYEYNGLTYQFREGEQPDGAVELPDGSAERKGRQATAKQRTPRNKGAQASDDRKR